MTPKNVLAVLIPAALLAIVAYLIELSTHLPEPVAYFAIALLAASLTLLLTGSSVTTSRSQAKSKRPAPSPTRQNDNNISNKSSSKERGSVKWFSASKGFGFITRENGEDIFVHFRSINGSGHKVLREGQQVEFAVTTGDKGLQAEEVVALK